MTATKVNGLEVIATEQVRSPLWREERPVFYTNSMQLLLEDGSTVYACVFCDYTSSQLGKVRHHQIADCLNNPKPSAAVRGEAMRGIAAAKTNPPKANGKKPVLPVVKSKPKPVKAESNGHDDIDPQDLMAALELALSGPKDTEELDKLRAENTKLRNEIEMVTSEREWWKDKYMNLNQVLAHVRERLATAR